MQIFFIVVGALALYVLYRVKKQSDKYKHIPGLSTADFLKDYSNIAKRTARWTKEKLAKVETPVFTIVLATHPDSVKVTHIKITG